jgi:methyl-accepting chemotaxis protein
MSRVANLPIAARLGIAFGLLAAALLALTLTATHAFGTFHDETENVDHRYVRALAVAGQLGQDLQGTGRETAEHLYVYDGNLKAEDAIQARVEKLRRQTTANGATLVQLLHGTAADEEASKFTTHAIAWSGLVEDALRQSRAETLRGDEDRAGSRTLFQSRISPQTDELAAEALALQDAVRAETNASVERVAAGASHTSRVLLLVMLVALAIAAAFAVMITRSVVRPVRGLMDRLQSLDAHCLQDLTDGLEAAAKGDLTLEATPVTAPLDVRTKDELGRLSATFNEMLAKAQRGIVAYTTMRAELSSLIGEVARNAGSVSAASQQVAAASEEGGRAVGEIANAVTDVAGGAERQVRMVENTRDAVLEANRAAQASASAAEATAKAASEARRVARDGVVAAATATEAIRSVATASTEVGAAIRTFRPVRSASAGS